jgi:hypothetical protein
MFPPLFTTVKICEFPDKFVLEFFFLFFLLAYFIIIKNNQQLYNIICSKLGKNKSKKYYHSSKISINLFSFGFVIYPLITIHPKGILHYSDITISYMTISPIFAVLLVKIFRQV